MKIVLVAVLLGMHAILAAQPLPEASPEPTPQSQDIDAQPEPAATAFALEIKAPDDIKLLLERHLELQRYRSLSDLSNDELERLLDMARTDTQNLVATLGYFAPDIRIERLNPENASPSSPPSIRISVVAGEPVQVSQVLIQFAGPVATDPQAAAQRLLIQDSWSLPPGNRFTQTRWDAAKQQALRQLTSQRYPTGRISQTLADIDPASNTALLTLTLESGQPYQLGNLVITGLQRFDATLVQRLARLQTGVDFDQKQLVDAQLRLSASGFFDSAFVSLDTSSDPQAAQVLVSVREARLQKITLGVGASTDSGARLSVEHLHHQVPWLGWRTVSKLSLDRETRSASIELTSPPNASGWRWNTSALAQSQLSGTFEVDSQRLRAGASQTGDRIDRTYYLQYDRADTVATDLSAPRLAESVSANYTFTMRNFNALPFPASGWGFGAELGGGTTLGSDQVPFGRVVVRGQTFWPLGQGEQANSLRQGRLVARAEVGAVLARDAVSLPVTQLFLAGGDNSVRGYGLRDIGIKLGAEQVSAGRYLAVGSLEWQRPITIKGLLTDWEGALFVDAGAVADRPADLHAQVGVGAGLRWKTPVGPLQIDLAYGVAVQQFRLHLNVGFSF